MITDREVELGGRNRFAPVVHQDPGAEAYDHQQRTRVLRRLRQRAATLGFELINRQTGEILEAGVSQPPWKFLGDRGPRRLKR